MKYGFIGCGNMGGAVARAVCKGAGAGGCAAGQPHTSQSAGPGRRSGPVPVAPTSRSPVSAILFFWGSNPQMMADMLDELAPTLEARAESRPFVLVSMAAGLSMQQIRHMAGSGYPIIRMMPNTPGALGAGGDLAPLLRCDDVEPAQLQEWLAPCSPPGGWTKCLRR